VLYCLCFVHVFINCSDNVVLFVFCTRLHKWVKEGWYKNENIYVQNTNCYINSKRGYGSLVLTLVVSYIWNTRCWRVSTICPLPLPSLLLCEYILSNHFCVISTIVSSFIWIVGALFPSSYWYIKPEVWPLSFRDLSLAKVFDSVLVVQYLAFCVVFCRPLFVFCFMSSIVCFLFYVGHCNVCPSIYDKDPDGSMRLGSWIT
jgi:hypothetical protein